MFYLVLLEILLREEFVNLLFVETVCLLTEIAVDADFSLFFNDLHQLVYTELVQSIADSVLRAGAEKAQLACRVSTYLLFVVKAVKQDIIVEVDQLLFFDGAGQMSETIPRIRIIALL